MIKSVSLHVAVLRPCYDLSCFASLDRAFTVTLFIVKSDVMTCSVSDELSIETLLQIVSIL